MPRDTTATVSAQGIHHVIEPHPVRAVLWWLLALLAVGTVGELASH
jgi:hypothetical protein